MQELWLDHFGFHFNPFEYEEASSDPNINRYLIGYDAFSVAWREVPALVFSPPGGGKTALRIYTSRACWTGGGGHQPFPIHYHLPHYFERSNFSTLDDHLQKIIHSSAVALFLAFSYYPLIFLRSSASLQKHFVQFISIWIPNLAYYLEILQTTNQPDIVAAQIDRSYILHQVPDASLLQLASEIFSKYISSEDKFPISTSAQKAFEQLVTWITRDLGFRAVYLLVDGIDGFPELAKSPSFAAQSLTDLFAEAPSWLQKRVFIKGFLPIEVRDQLYATLGAQWSAFGQVELKWDENMLAEMIRKRVYAATDGEFASLGAVSAIPVVQDLELELAHITYPLPREMLVLVKRILFEYEQRYQRSSPTEKRIYDEDIEKALTWYRVEQASITKVLSSLSERIGR